MLDEAESLRCRAPPDELRSDREKDLIDHARRQKFAEQRRPTFRDDEPEPASVEEGDESLDRDRVGIAQGGDLDVWSERQASLRRRAPAPVVARITGVLGSVGM